MAPERDASSTRRTSAADGAGPGSGAGAGYGSGSVPLGLGEELARLRRRLFGQANTSVDMLESALEALWSLNASSAAEIRRRDDRVDAEEIGIEQECYRLLMHRQPLGPEFRLVAFCLKVNVALERVADHATSIAKITIRLEGNRPPAWPMALQDMAERVLVTCHSLLRAASDEDIEAARRLRVSDDILDGLDRQVFREVEQMIGKDARETEQALLLYRVGRELERVGDLMGNIAEDVIYLVTGEIVRHQKD